MTRPATWRFRLNPVGTSELRLCASFSFKATERSIVACVSGSGPDGDAIDPVEGLHWSAQLQSHFIYASPDDDGVWMASPMKFAAPLVGLEVSMFRWPSQGALDSGAVTRVFLLASSEVSLDSRATIVMPGGY